MMIATKHENDLADFTQYLLRSMHTQFIGNLLKELKHIASGDASAAVGVWRFDVHEANQDAFERVLHARNIKIYVEQI